MSCIKGAANGGFSRFSHLLLFASKADTDRNDKILQHRGDSPKQLQLPVLIWTSKYKIQPSLISTRYFALWSYLCLNSLFYMYVSLKLKQRHTEADYKNKFNIFRTILQHLNECHGVACIQQNVKLSQPPGGHGCIQTTYEEQSLASAASQTRFGTTLASLTWDCSYK